MGGWDHYVAAVQHHAVVTYCTVAAWYVHSAKLFLSAGVSVLLSISAQTGLMLSSAMVKSVFGITSRYLVVPQAVLTQLFLTYYVGTLSSILCLFTE